MEEMYVKYIQDKTTKPDFYLNTRSTIYIGRNEYLITCIHDNVAR